MSRISERATAHIQPLPEKEKPISEQYRLLAEQWADAENAAHIMEELKTTTLEQKKSALIEATPGMAENRAERLVKTGKEWEQYIRQMCGNRGNANRLKQRLEYMKMRHREWIAADANARSEKRL